MRMFNTQLKSLYPFSIIKSLVFNSKAVTGIPVMNMLKEIDKVSTNTKLFVNNV